MKRMIDHGERIRLAKSWVGMLCATALVVLTPMSGCSSGDKPVAPPATSASPTSAPPTERVVGPLSPDDAKALETMIIRVKEYVDQVAGIERSAGTLPKEATPQQIDQHQRTLEKRVREKRVSAKPGDIFTAEAQPVIKRLIAAVFEGPEGKQLKSSIMDENPAPPGAARVVVNGRYPDTVPLTTVPPQVLQTLPKLTRDLEYRFVGDSLILLDGRAHIIVDFIEHALPK